MHSGHGSHSQPNISMTDKHDMMDHSGHNMMDHSAQDVLQTDSGAISHNSHGANGVCVNLLSTITVLEVRMVANFLR